MGTSFDVGISDDQIGIIPRAAKHLFDGMRKRKEEAEKAGQPSPEFTVSAQFLEVFFFCFKYFLKLLVKKYFIKFIIY